MDKRWDTHEREWEVAAREVDGNREGSNSFGINGEDHFKKGVVTVSYTTKRWSKK